VLGRLHDGGAGDHVGVAVIHFGEQAEADGADLAELIVGTDTRSRAGFIAGAKSGCASPVAMPGIGAAAMHCRPVEKTFATFIAVAKNSHGQLRTAELYLVPESGDAACAELGKLLADRL